MSSPMLRFYTEEYVEADRLSRSANGRLELLRTQELLTRHLPAVDAGGAAGPLVADIGGGPGAYAAWLVSLGYRVRLVDVVPTHIEQARAALPGVDAEVGDARTLPWPENCVDAALLLGPLYHLATRTDRLAALAEAARVTRPGGVVAAAAISRTAPLLDLAVQSRLTDDALSWARAVISSGHHDTRLGFTEAYLHSSAELADELADAGLHNVVVYGIEGPLWPATRLLAPDADLTQYAAVARELEVAATAVELSGHLLAIGYI